MANTRDTSASQNSRNSPRGEEKDTEENVTDERRPQPKERRPKPMEVLRQARAQLSELTGMPSENVSSFEQTEDGWSVEIEVLELSRVPDTMSLMASYQVELDSEGQLTGYRRVRRYERGRSDAHRQGGR
ncbi:gas vesicle protein [Streptomyces sp. NPDC057253]|uniref:gas vesicle protein GvpO n=1 Tax=Streptomyces sp. NPDC057253 TaxID=3346069 RepID=UPI003644DA8F